MLIPSDGLSLNVLDSDASRDKFVAYPAQLTVTRPELGFYLPFYSRMEETQGWQAIAAKKRQIQRDLSSSHQNHVNETTHRENANSATDTAAFSKLVAQLSKGKVSCETVIKAYIAR